MDHDPTHVLVDTNIYHSFRKHHLLLSNKCLANVHHLNEVYYTNRCNNNFNNTNGTPQFFIKTVVMMHTCSCAWLTFYYILKHANKQVKKEYYVIKLDIVNSLLIWQLWEPIMILLIESRTISTSCLRRCFRKRNDILN